MPALESRESDGQVPRGVLVSLRFNEDDDCGLLTTAPYCLTPKPTGLLALVRWARFFPILSEAALILIYAPRAACGSTDMRRLCPRRIFLYLPLIFITFASQHGGRRSTLAVLASIAQRFCAPTTIPRRRPGALNSQTGCHSLQVRRRPYPGCPSC